MERTALGRRELEALGALDVIAEMDGVPLSRRRSNSKTPTRSPRKSPSRKTPTRSPRRSPTRKTPTRSPPKRTPSIKITPKLSTRMGEITSSPLGTLDKRTRRYICREVSTSPVINQLGIESLKDQDYMDKIIELFNNRINEFCRIGREKKEIKPLKTPHTTDKISSLITNSNITKIIARGIFLNIVMAFFEAKYKHLDISFYNPLNDEKFEDINFLKIDITFEKGKEEEATIRMFEKNEKDFEKFIRFQRLKKSIDGSPKYVAGLYLLRVTEKSETLTDTWHTNAFFYDTTTGQLELMEPYGYLGHLSHLPGSIVYNLVGEQMARILPGMYSWKTINVNFQDAEDSISREKSRLDPWGFCVFWAVWLLEQKIQNINKDITKHLKDAKPTLGDLRQYIRGYSLFFYEIYTDYKVINKSIKDIYQNAIRKSSTTDFPINWEKFENNLKDLIFKIYLLATLD